jgi:hypothetical protein
MFSPAEIAAAIDRTEQDMRARGYDDAPDVLDHLRDVLGLDLS